MNDFYAVAVVEDIVVVVVVLILMLKEFYPTRILSTI
jgi:hypothetical protein